MAQSRFRLQQVFWLDVNKPEQQEVAEIIEELKQNRTFSRVIRDGIRLMWSLGQGNPDILMALFPWVEDALYERFAQQQPTSDFTLQKQLARLERLLIEQGGLPLETATAGPKQLEALQSVPLKTEDANADLLVVKRAQSERDSAKNFLNSAFDLVQ